MKIDLRTAAAAALIIAAPSAALAELSTNFGLASQYVFRGFDQSGDNVAAFGGIDYSHASGFYAGSWASGVDKGAEVDFYLGYSGEASGFGYDVGFITYEYTDKAFFDGSFREFYLGGSYGPVSLKYYAGYDTASNADYGYTDLGASWDIGEYSLGGHIGFLDPDGGQSVNDYSVSLGRTLFGFDWAAQIANEDATDETEYFLTVSKSWDVD